MEIERRVIFGYRGVACRAPSGVGPRLVRPIAPATVRQPAGNDESYALPTASGGLYGKPLYGKPLEIGAAETRMNAASAPVDSARTAIK